MKQPAEKRTFRGKGEGAPARPAVFTLLRFPRGNQRDGSPLRDTTPEARGKAAYDARLQALRDRIHVLIVGGLTPLAEWLARRGLSPNIVTVAGLAVNGVAAALIVAGALVPAGVLWLFAGLLDLLDGTAARTARRATSFGGFLDSTCDRVSEGLVFAAIVYHFAAQGAATYAALTTAALLGSLLISYTRARAEALGAECKVGIATRAERVILLAIGLCFDLLPLAIGVMVALTLFTFGQRVWHTYTQLKDAGDA